MNRLFTGPLLGRSGTLLVLAVLLLSIAACRRGNEGSPAQAPVEPASSVTAQADGSSAATNTPEPAFAATETPIPTPTPASGTITVWHSWAQRDGDALDTILRELHERRPTLQIDTLFVAQSDLLQSYAQAVADGSGPDVVLAPNWWLNDLKTLGVVEPLDESLYEQAIANSWPAAVDNLRIDSKAYGVPTNFETVALYYNRALVDEADLPQTLDDLYVGAQANPQQGIGVYANPFHVAWGFPAFGVALFDDAGHAVFDRNSGGAQFLQWLADVNALEGSYVDADYGMLVDRFKRGEYAFFVDGPWSLGELSEALGEDLGVTVLPSGPGGLARPWLFADAAYVNPALPAEQAVLAAEFAENLVSPRGGEIISDIGGRLPASREIDLSHDAILAGFAAQAAVADAMPHGPQMDAFWRYGGDMILKALNSPGDMQAVAAEATALTNDASGK